MHDASARLAELYSAGVFLDTFGFPAAEVPHGTPTVVPAGRLAEMLRQAFIAGSEADSETLIDVDREDGEHPRISEDEFDPIDDPALREARSRLAHPHLSEDAPIEVGPMI